MTGFGKPQRNTESSKDKASKSRTKEAIKNSIIAYQQGDLEGAKTGLEKILQADQTNSLVLGILATVEKALGNKEKALKLFKKSTDLSQNNSDILNNYASILMEKDFAKSIYFSDKAVKISPENSSYLVRNGYLKWKAGDLDNALKVTIKAIRLDPKLVDAHLNLGSMYKDLGNLNQALISTLRSLELNPDNPDAHMNLGGIYKDLGKLDQALSSTLKSLELNPDNPATLVNLGNIYKSLERIEEAKTAFNQVLRATKKDTSTITKILNFYDSINEEELLKKAIIYLKSVLPGESLRIKMYEARELFRQKKYEESWEKLPTLDSTAKHLNDYFSIKKYHSFRAQIAEKNNNYDAAYYSFKASQVDPLLRLIDHKKEHERIDQYIKLSINMSKHGSPDYTCNPIQNASHPVFLLGFPRSGTTLLDTVLRSHPDVEVIEEKAPLALTERFGIKSLGSQIFNFNSLNEDDLNKMREFYITQLKIHSTDSGKLIIDKLPLHTIAIPLINLLFPNAKIIFALRHPCDSILSCFQQTFKPNRAMANFTDLEKAIDFYDKVMHGWTIYNKNLDLDHITSKYEDLVINFDENISKALKHINLPWNDGVRNYRRTALNRPFINTPSSSQVIQPLYKSSIGRWKNYQKYFSEHMYKLNPWINYFGYDL